MQDRLGQMAGDGNLADIVIDLADIAIECCCMTQTTHDSTLVGFCD